MRLKSLAQKKKNIDDTALLKVRLGLGNGGLGLRSAAETAPAAYVASVIAASAHIVAALPPDADISPRLADTLTATSLQLRTRMPLGHQAAALLPADNPGQLLRQYASEAPPARMQQVLCHAIDTHTEERIRARLSAAPPDETRKAKQARLARLALHISTTAPYASYWLQACGHSRSVQLPDADVGLSVRRLLGLPAVSGPSHAVPASCTCGVSLEGNTWHGMHCNRTRRTVVTRGHDTVGQHLAIAARRAGAHATIEPTDLTWTNNNHPDGEIVMGAELYWYDVTIRDPGAPTHAATGARGQLRCAAAAEQQKNNKYQQMAQASHATFVPVALEATGAVGTSARELLNRVLDWGSLNQTMLTKHELRLTLMFAIAVAIQRRNAAATRICLQHARASERQGRGAPLYADAAAFFRSL